MDPLHCTSVINLMLAARADINKARTDTGATPLQAAAERGHVDISFIMFQFVGLTKCELLEWDALGCPLRIVFRSNPVSVEVKSVNIGCLS